jgi:hypothetical protein
VTDVESLESFCLVGGIPVIIVSLLSALHAILIDGSGIHLEEAFTENAVGSFYLHSTAYSIGFDSSDVHIVGG